MWERLELLKGRLPESIIDMIREYDSHSVADLIREIMVRHFRDYGFYPPSLVLKLQYPRCFLPTIPELKRRLQHNRTRHLHGGLWLPIFFYSWMVEFHKCNCEAPPELPDWVKEDYLAPLKKRDQARCVQTFDGRVKKCWGPNKSCQPSR